jgi:TolB-like protein
MIWSTNFFIRLVAIGLFSAFWIGGCASVVTVPTAPLEQATLSIAVMPIQNLSGVAVPTVELRQRLLLQLERIGFALTPESQLQAFMVANRVRYLGGMNETMAVQMKSQTDAGAVLFCSLELFDNYLPPRIAISARLVSTGTKPKILWMQGAALSGDDSMGLLELKRIDSMDILIDQALNQLTGSLADHFRPTERASQPQNGRQFNPDILYRTSVPPTKKPDLVAVLPFLNLSQRKHAGSLMQLHFAKNIQRIPDLEVVEPGITRQALLQARIIMVDGISLTDAGNLFEGLQADLILSGRVFDYEDYQGETGETAVCFSAMLLEKENRKVAWSTQSCRNGGAGVWFFDLGKIRTAHALADAMVRGAVESIAP